MTPETTETGLSDLPTKQKPNGRGIATTTVDNRKPLPPERAAAVAYGLEQFQTIAHERDELKDENTELKDRVAALEIETEGLRSQLTEAQSQIRSALLVRDQALADRIKYEALFISLQAQMRAFAVPSEPLIRDAT